MIASGQPERRRRRTLLALLLLIALIALALYLLLGGSGTTTVASGTGGGTTAGGAPATGTVTVERRDLAVTATVAGKLSRGKPQTVLDHLSGTITALPHVGQVIQAGQTLFKIGATPVVLLYGSSPVSRDLSPADSAGPDIYELNSNLVALGYDRERIVVDDVWQNATTLGVEELQAHLGEPQTGDLSFGDVVFLPTSQIVEGLDAAVGGTAYAAAAPGASAQSGSSSALSGSSSAQGGSSSAQGGSSSGASVIGSDFKITPGHNGPSDSEQPASERAEVLVGRKRTASSTATMTFTTEAPTGTTTTPTTANAGSTTQTATTPTSTAPDTTETAADETTTTTATTTDTTRKTVKPGAETTPQKSVTGTTPAQGTANTTPQQAGSSPDSSSGSSAGESQSGSDQSGSGQSPTTSSSEPSGLPMLSTTSTRPVVSVQLSQQLKRLASVGRRVAVKLADGSTVQGTVSAVGTVAKGSAIPVTITLSAPLPGRELDQAAVSVSFVLRDVVGVLSVPSTALVGTTDGGHAVRQAASPHSLLPVETGISDGGYVEVSGPGIHQGLVVEVFGGRRSG